MQTMNDRSARLLSGCHPDLQRVVRRAYTILPPVPQVIITCGQRSEAEQRKLVAAGFSKTMRSRHIPDERSFSHAVDFAVMLNGKLRWDWPPFSAIAKAMKEAAKLEKVPVEWGGDWKTFKDGPHFQLPWARYPARGLVAGLMTASSEEGDILDGFQEVVANTGISKPTNLNNLWAIVTGGGGSGFLTMLYGLDWRAIALILAVASIWAAIYIYLKTRKNIDLLPTYDDEIGNGEQ